MLFQHIIRRLIPASTETVFKLYSVVSLQLTLQ